MSVWTHVVGSIYFDDFTFNKQEDPLLIKEIITKRLLDNLPDGSEGPLEFKVLQGGECGSISTPDGNWKTTSYRWVVTVWGDLRDYEDVWAIKEWFLKVFKSKDISIRDAIVSIYCENGHKCFMHTEDFELEEKP